MRILIASLALLFVVAPAEAKSRKHARRAHGPVALKTRALPHAAQARNNKAAEEHARAEAELSDLRSARELNLNRDQPVVARAPQEDDNEVPGQRLAK